MRIIIFLIMTAREKAIILAILTILIVMTSAVAASAQVPVSQEPRHHNVFDNGLVRILDVRIPPGDTTLFHKHSTPSVFIVLSSTKTGSGVIVEPAKRPSSTGNIWYESFEDKPRIHRVWNSDTSQFHVIDMELPGALHTPSSLSPSGAPPSSQAVPSSRAEAPPSTVQAGPALDSAASPRERARFMLLFAEQPVRGYRVTVDAGTKITVPARKTGIVVIGLKDMNEASGGREQMSAASVQVNGTKMGKKGAYIYIAPGNKITIFNATPQEGSLGVFELLFDGKRLRR